MYRAGGVVASLALFGFAACLSFDELQGGVDAGNADATNADANISDATNDTGNLGDSAIDASFDAGSSFCSKNPGHSFCDDFDEAADYRVGPTYWTSPYISSLSSLGVTVDASVSPPSSLIATLPLTAGTTQTARLSKTLAPLGVTHVHVEFDVQMCEVPDTGMGSYELFKLGFDGISTGNGIDFQVKPGQAYIAANGHTYVLASTLDQAWNHVAVDMHLGNGTSTTTVAFNGAQVSPQDASVAPAFIDFDASFLSVVGLYGNDAPACTAYFDNVVMDYE